MPNDSLEVYKNVNVFKIPVIYFNQITVIRYYNLYFILKLNMCTDNN